MSAFLDTLDVEKVATDDVLFQVVNHPFRYQSDVYGGVISVPVGFRTDFESMPRYIPFLYSLLGGIAWEPSVVHDWLYFAGFTTQEMADKVIYEAMGLVGINSVKRWLIYQGLKIGGYKAWAAHRRDGNSWRDFPGSYTPNTSPNL